jgi:predicted Zn-dependent protease
MTSPAARLQEAYAHLRDKRFADARDVLDGLVRDELADATVWETLGDVREKLGDDDGAVEAWKIAAEMWMARQQAKRAASVLELLLILRPDDEEASALLAQVGKIS